MAGGRLDLPRWRLCRNSPTSKLSPCLLGWVRSCTCIYMCVYVYVYVCMYIYNMHLCVCVCVCVCMCVCTCMCVCVCICMYVCMYVSKYVCMDGWMYIHVTSEPIHPFRPHAVNDTFFCVLLKFCFIKGLTQGPPLVTSLKKSFLLI
jgi:hypothetical protein